MSANQEKSRANLENAMIGFVIGLCGMGMCVALAALIHLTEPYWPAARDLLIWCCDPRLVIGMVLGIILAAAVICCSDMSYRRTGGL